LLSASLDQLRESYRRIDLAFASAPSEREFRIAGVEKIRTRERQMSVFASKNAETVIERARDLNAVSIEVVSVGLRDIFLEAVKEN
jgi:ABC-2 type transport system ATP-binding protein